MTKIFIEGLYQDSTGRGLDIDVPNFSYECKKEVRYMKEIHASKSPKKLKLVGRAAVDGETFRRNQNKALEGMCDLTDGQISRMAWCIRCKEQECIRQAVLDILEEAKE